MTVELAIPSLHGMTVQTLGQLYVILGSDRGLVGVALYRVPPKNPLVLLCGASRPPKRKQRGMARFALSKRRRLRAARGNR